MAKYYKITNDNETNGKVHYHDGLNILKEEFNVPVHKYSSLKTGFGFVTIDNIHRYYADGVYIREVHLPENDPEFRIVEHQIGNNKRNILYRSNKIILGNKYSLFDPETYQKLGLNMTDNESLINNASRVGNIDFLEKWKNMEFGSNLKHNIKAIDVASFRGKIESLNWWKNSGLPMLYSERAIDVASIKGNIEVLDWWKNSGLLMKYSAKAINVASFRGKIESLNWWKNSGLKLLYTEESIDYISTTQNHSESIISTLNWWLKSGLDPKYSEKSINIAAKNGNINIINWWINSGLPILFTNKNKISISIKDYIEQTNNDATDRCMIIHHF